MLRRCLYLIFVLSLIAAGVAAWLFVQWKDFLETPLSSQAFTYEIPAGTGISALSKNLQKKGFIKHAYSFMILARLEEKTTEIKAGRYAIPAGMKPAAFLQKIVDGDVISYEITLIEGWNFQQMMAEIEQDPNLVHRLKDLSPQEIMLKLGHPNQHPEGQFFPDTYYFTAGYSDEQLLQRAYKTMQKKLQAAWETRDDDLPYNNAYQALIAASLIEKETSINSEKPLVSGVIKRRLEKNMRLQIDPTVIYALGDAYTGKIYRQDLRVNSPYNTYVNTGLPPTPISMPGNASLQAAVHPAAGRALYFVANGDGSHQFSNSLSAHNKAVRSYRAVMAKQKQMALNRKVLIEYCQLLCPTSVDVYLDVAANDGLNRCTISYCESNK